MHTTNCLVCAVTAAFTLQATAQERRSLDAHEHGQGALNVAIEGDRISMELEAPGFDIVGFEHAAETEADRAAVEAALERISKPLDLFALPEKAGCETVEYRAELMVDGDHDGHGHDDEDGHHDEGHDGDGHDGHHDGHADGDGHDEGHENETTHSEFQAEYLLTCTDIGSATRLDLRYFEVFQNAESLTVQLVTDQGSTLVTGTRENPTLDLSDAMGN